MLFFFNLLTKYKFLQQRQCFYASIIQIKYVNWNILVYHIWISICISLECSNLFDKGLNWNDKERIQTNQVLRKMKEEQNFGQTLEFHDGKSKNKVFNSFWVGKIGENKKLLLCRKTSYNLVMPLSFLHGGRPKLLFFSISRTLDTLTFS